MLSRFAILLFVPLLLLSATGLHAQDKDYLKHGKIFNLCSYKLECSDCKNCNKMRYMLKLKNNTDKKITGISVKFYSDVFNRILEKDGKIEADAILGKQIGYAYVCVPNGEHWIISKLTYDDGSTNTFTIADRMDNFIQEADECDCN